MELQPEGVTPDLLGTLGDLSLQLGRALLQVGLHCAARVFHRVLVDTA